MNISHRIKAHLLNHFPISKSIFSKIASLQNICSGFQIPLSIVGIRSHPIMKGEGFGMSERYEREEEGGGERGLPLCSHSCIQQAECN